MNSCIHLVWFSLSQNCKDIVKVHRVYYYSALIIVVTFTSVIVGAETVMINPNQFQNIREPVNTIDDDRYNDVIDDGQ